MSARSVLLASAMGTLFACVTIGPPLVFDIRSQEPLRTVHQCVTEQVVDRGFRVTETRRDDGVLSAAKVSNSLPARWDLISVLIFERTDGSTSIQFTAGSRVGNEGSYGPPTPYVRMVAEQVSEICGTGELGLAAPPPLDSAAIAAHEAEAALLPRPRYRLMPGYEWAGSQSRRTLYWLGEECKAWHDLPRDDLIFFPTAEVAINQGYRISTYPGCRGPGRDP